MYSSIAERVLTEHGDPSTVRNAVQDPASSFPVARTAGTEIPHRAARSTVATSRWRRPLGVDAHIDLQQGAAVRGEPRSGVRLESCRAERAETLLDPRLRRLRAAHHPPHLQSVSASRALLPCEEQDRSPKPAEAEGVDHIARRLFRSTATVGTAPRSTPENPSGVDSGHEVMLRTCEG